MKRNIALLILLVAVSLISCAPKGMYNWENYSETLYSYKKNSNEESLLKHMQELKKIIEASNQNNMRIPPGVYGELGYYYLKNNKTKEAIEYFNLEKQLYPESGILMERLIQKATAADKLIGEVQSKNTTIKESEK
jgi:hypothetical protein